MYDVGKNSKEVEREQKRQGCLFFIDANFVILMQTVSTARLIYIDIGQVNDYAAWVKTLDYVEVTNADLDHATYEAAEKQYLDNNTNRAIKQFNGYLNEFPNGLHALQSHFYLAQLYFKENLKDNAAPHYQYVLESTQNEFTEEILC